MNLQPGIFIKSTEALSGSVFENATIFITEYNKDGAVGFIINRPFGRTLNELEEFKQDTAFPLYNGGPVEAEHIYFLHRRPDLVTDATKVANGIYLGGNFRQAVDAINNGEISAAQIKIFVGYCGWDGGELEAEIEEGSWVVVEEELDAVFG